MHCRLFFFFNDTATTEIYTLSLHDALPISRARAPRIVSRTSFSKCASSPARICRPKGALSSRSEEHTSELQSRLHLVCRLLLEKKKITTRTPQDPPLRCGVRRTSVHRAAPA